MTDLHSSFISKTFLQSHWAIEYKAWAGSDQETLLLERLKLWAARKDLKETSAEAAFIDVFFRDTWDYDQSGQAAANAGFTLYPKFPLQGTGARGGTGEADLAIGYFGLAPEPIPQVLCEFKDVKSALDAEQKRKGNTRTPVRQCLDYLAGARRGFVGSEPILPTWALVTDMNEFRLYWYDRGHQQSVRFVIEPRDLFQGDGLLKDSPAARYERFLFHKIFHRDTLLTRGGKCLLEALIQQQRFSDRKLENEFYAEYRKFREHLYLTLLAHNGEGTDRFPGTKGRLVRLAQKILDRFIFIFYCEDMGQALSFPPQILRDFLIRRSNDPYFDPDGNTVWQEMVALFDAMNLGKAFGGRALNQFNGGLFAADPALDRLKVPNSIFCQPMQGQNEASLYGYKQTLLYLCASYNYATGWTQSLSKPPVIEGDAKERDPAKSLGLYTLGRIFEQSITELEILEAEAEGRPSLNKESKRKRDGVYYTPEWIVEKIVDETLGPRLTSIKAECGLPSEDRLPDEEKIAALDKFAERLKTFAVVDPACGSGAFLITALRYLLDIWRSVRSQRKLLNGKAIALADDDDAAIRDILRSNIYGVDINAASVEIARLALWLHTARGDKPLSSLETTIREGNSLIDSRFYKGQTDMGFYDDTEKERVNAFDWEKEFAEVFARGGFDAVIGNPPYVKLQNFRKVHSDMAEYLRDGRPGTDMLGYKSAQTGNFDLYLPFIEKGMQLLNSDGRLGYIAPSLWTVNEYGKGLRDLVAKNGWLNTWIDFKSYQVFEEATTYTALQFYSKRPSELIEIFPAPDGDLSHVAWSNNATSIARNKLAFDKRWLMLDEKEKQLVDRLDGRCRPLSDPVYTTNIYQGLITSADAVYHLEKVGPDRYLCTPSKDEGLPYEVEIEDAIMKPLVSGVEAKRYQLPVTNTYLLFPYKLENGVKLLTEKELERFPKAWRYLKSWERNLRRRERYAKPLDDGRVGPFDDHQWYRFGRHQNLDKQECKKLIVAQTVPSLRVCFDDTAAYYLNNVRVNGIIAAEATDPWFLLGVLNGPVANYVFKRIAKPKDGGFYEANRQFIAPLPIPYATVEQQAEVAASARKLQEGYTRRRDILLQFSKRLQTLRPKLKSETWLFPGLPSQAELEADGPSRLDTMERRQWAKNRFREELMRRLDTVALRLKPTAVLDASFSKGELRFLIDGVPVLQDIFEGENEGAFILAQWKALCATFAITPKTTAEKLCVALRKLAPHEPSPAVGQIGELVAELNALDLKLKSEEKAINKLVYSLYPLDEDDIRRIEAG